MEKAIQESPDTPLKKLVLEQESCYYGGVLSPDSSVIYYYQNYPIGKKYLDTHNWNFVNELEKRAKSDCEKAFVLGVSTHLVQDGVDHNFFIPKVIESTYIVNYLSHPMAEGVRDTAHLSPKIAFAMSKMDDVDPVSGRTLTQFFNEALGKDFTNEMRILRTALTDPNAQGKLWGGLATPISGNSNLYSIYSGITDGNLLIAGFLLLIGGLLFFNIWKSSIPGKIIFLVISSLIIFIGIIFVFGLTKLVDTSNAIPLEERSIQETILIFQGTRSPLDPSGLEAIGNADAGPNAVKNIVLIIALVYLAWSIKNKLLKKRSKKRRLF